MRRENLVIRVTTVLVDLERQAEGKAMSWEGRVSAGKPDSAVLSGGQSDFDAAMRTLEAWCDGAERHVVRGRPKPDTTPEELGFRILNDYVGRNSEKVAEDEGCTRQYVEDLRERHKLTRRHGRPNRKTTRT